jgi:hypothetical protein
MAHTTCYFNVLQQCVHWHPGQWTLLRTDAQGRWLCMPSPPKPMSVPDHVEHRESFTRVCCARKTDCDSSVGVGMGNGLYGRGSIPGKTKRFFFSSQRSDRLWCPPSILSNEYRASSPGVKAAKVWSWSRKMELYLHTPYVFMAWCLIN